MGSPWWVARVISGLLENPRTKWRFIAGKCIYTWGIFKRFDYWRILEGSKGYCIGAPRNQLAESCHKRLSKLLKMGIWFHKQTLVGTASNMPFGLWYVAQNLELQWAWKALWFRTTCCWLSIGPMLISATAIMAPGVSTSRRRSQKTAALGEVLGTWTLFGIKIRFLYNLWSWHLESRSQMQSFGSQVSANHCLRSVVVPNGSGPRMVAFHVSQETGVPGN